MEKREETLRDKRIYDVEIAGVPLKLKTHNASERVEELVQLVNSEVLTALDGSQNRSLQNAAIIAALNIAERMIRERESLKSELGELQLNAEALVADLESPHFTQIDH